jgi:hypothetical protein
MQFLKRLRTPTNISTNDRGVSIDSVPNDILLEIIRFSNDSPKQLASLERVCKRFQTMIGNENIWQNHFNSFLSEKGIIGFHQIIAFNQSSPPSLQYDPYRGELVTSFSFVSLPAKQKMAKISRKIEEEESTEQLKLRKVQNKIWKSSIRRQDIKKVTTKFDRIFSETGIGHT